MNYPGQRASSVHLAGLLRTGFAGVALGIARASLDVFVDLARNKVPRGMRSPIRDNAVVQSGVAQAEVRLHAARAFMLQSVQQIWKEVEQPRGVLTLEHRMTLRMASTQPIHSAGDAVDSAYNAAGTRAIFESHPLERRFGDIHTVAQHPRDDCRISRPSALACWAASPI